MIAYLTELFAGVPETFHRTRKPASIPEELLTTVRKQNPGLQIDDAFVMPLWFFQQRTWFEDPAGSDSAVYNFSHLLRIRGPLNESALRQSLQELVRRHSVLRSVFRVMEGKLIQIILAPQPFALSATQLSGSAGEKNQQLQVAAHAEARQPFYLANGPMLRAKLMRLQPDEHVLQLTTHHLTYDDWSNGVLIHELGGLYRAFAEGTTPSGSPARYQYGDFVRWQQKQLQTPEWKLQQEYCKQQLDSPTGFQHLPTDFPQPARNVHAGARQKAVLSAAQADALNLLCRQQRVSLFMVLLAGFTCLLHRYSGHEEIGVGSCVANRPLEEVEGLIGRFGNSTILRTSLSGNPTFSELLNRVKEVSLKTWSNQEQPLGMLLTEMAEENGRSPQAPCQVMFVLQNAPKEQWQIPGLKVEWSSVDTPTAKYDLNVWLRVEPALEITFEYNTQMFASSTISKFLAEFQAILDAMVQDPKKPVESVRISA